MVWPDRNFKLSEEAVLDIDILSGVARLEESGSFLWKRALVVSFNDWLSWFSFVCLRLVIRIYLLDPRLRGDDKSK